MERTGDAWAFGRSPFFGHRDLSGLMILMTMINNWDIDGPRNNAILRVTTPGGSVEHWYIVADLGATFGRMGGFASNHTKWDLANFLTEPFVERVSRERLDLDYDGLDPSLDTVPLEHAKWFAAKLAAKIAELSAAVATASKRAPLGFSLVFDTPVDRLSRLLTMPGASGP